MIFIPIPGTNYFLPHASPTRTRAAFAHGERWSSARLPPEFVPKVGVRHFLDAAGLWVILVGLRA